jgi:hypothetical protein
MAGIATRASTVGAPITHTFKLDDANATTGLCLNFKNDSGYTCGIRVGYYVVTGATSGHAFDIGITTTSGAQATTITDSSSSGGAGEAATVEWSDGNDVIADGSYLTIYNVATSTAAVATGLVAYAVVQMWPFCSVI